VTSSVGRISQLDGATLMKLQAGCNFINAEAHRRRNRVIIAGVVIAALTLLVHSRWIPDFRVFIGGGALILLAFAREQKMLSKTYKAIVVRRVVSALGHGLTYSAASSLTREHFLSMDLFEKRCEQWSAEDEVSGRKNEVSYAFHEAHATRTEGSGKNRRTVTIFRGVILRLDFNKNFRGHTVVVPQAESDILFGLLGESERRRSKQIVRLESAEFESVYSVYGTDDQEVHYLLTPKLMELVMRARQTISPGIRLSFQNNSVFVTIPQSKNRFEANLFGSAITPDGAAGDLVEVVTLAEQLIDVLDLETRIWSRV
jgi:hypothetical protein